MENTSMDYNVSILDDESTQPPVIDFYLSEKELAVLWDLYRLAVPIIFAIISFVGTFGNVLVLVVCVKNNTMKTLNNSLISCLAVADLVFLLLCVPTTAVVYSTPIWPFGVAMCKAMHYLIYVSIYVTIYLLCLMSFERFCAIVFPLKRLGIRSTRYLMYLTLGIMVFSLAMNIPALFIYDIQNITNVWGEDSEMCFYGDSIAFSSQYSLTQFFFMTFGVFVYVLPILFIVSMYSAIFYKLVNRKKISSANTSTAHIRAAKIILLLEVGFFVCYTPIQIMFILDKFTDFFKNDETFVAGCIVYVAGNVLSYTNSCLNPVLYTFVSNEYRNTLMSLVKRKDTGKPHKTIK